MDWEQEWHLNRGLAVRFMGKVRMRGREAWHLAQLSFWMAYTTEPEHASRRNTIWWRRFIDLVANLRTETTGPYCIPEKWARDHKNIPDKESIEDLVERAESRQQEGEWRSLPSALVCQDETERLVFWETVRSALDSRHYEVVVMYYCEERTLKEIAMQLGVSEVRAHQLLKEAIDTLRNELGGVYCA